MTDDRQMTDHAGEKWVAIGKITCTRAISPKNHEYFILHKVSISLECAFNKVVYEIKPDFDMLAILL